MKQIVILSGKGGTGKTSVAAAFAHLAAEGGLRTVLADADVDAANFGLVLEPERLEEHEFMGGQIAIIDPEKCTGCGICHDVCRFDAISELEDGTYTADPIACDGCAACVTQCPFDAIRMEEQLAGHWFRSESRYGPLFHAELLPAQENSGRLVTLVKQQARLLAMDEDRRIVIVDGPPGIGCPVISASSGADLAVIVAEPTASGIHDMERVLATTEHFGVPSLVLVNKADVYPDGADEIEAYCREHGINFIGRLPFDETVTEAMTWGRPVTEYNPDSPVSEALRAAWGRVLAAVSGADPG